jgi:hypothetical protein
MALNRKGTGREADYASGGSPEAANPPGADTRLAKRGGGDLGQYGTALPEGKAEPRPAVNRGAGGGSPGAVMKRNKKPAVPRPTT